MLVGPNHLHVLPRETGPRSLFTWVDDATVESPTEYWTVGHDASTSGDQFRLVNHTNGDTIPIEVRPDDTVVLDTLRVTGTVDRPLTLGGDTTEIAGFDDSGHHWIDDASGTTTEPAVGIERHADGDYTLHIGEGDQTGAVVTDTDIDSFDAATLDGVPPDAFVYRDGRYGLTADLPVGDHSVAFTDASVSASGGDLVLGATGAVQSDAPLHQQGNRVLDESDDLGPDVENTDGTPVVASADAITAGTDLSFSDDGDDTATLSFTGETEPASAAVGDTVTTSGDGSTTTFTLAHSLGTAPDSVTVEATARAASADFWVTGASASDVTVEYASAPPSGTDNLSWHLTTTASGLSAVTMSNDDAVVATNPDDINAGDGLTASDDGDGTATLGVAGGVARTDAAEHFPNAVSVGADTDLGFTNGSQTVQFAFAYDGSEDRHEWVDRANDTDVAHVDRDGHVNFPQNVQVGGVDVATTAGDLANQGSGSADSGAVPTADGDGNIQWERRTAGGGGTASGDGSTTTYAISHDLGIVPGDATVTPRSRAAMGAFYVSNLTESDVVITYDAAPPDGSANLDWSVTVHA